MSLLLNVVADIERRRTKLSPRCNRDKATEEQFNGSVNEVEEWSTPAVPPVPKHF